MNKIAITCGTILLSVLMLSALTKGISVEIADAYKFRACLDAGHIKNIVPKKSAN